KGQRTVRIDSRIALYRGKQGEGKYATRVLLGALSSFATTLAFATPFTQISYTFPGEPTQTLLDSTELVTVTHIAPEGTASVIGWADYGTLRSRAFSGGVVSARMVTAWSDSLTIDAEGLSGQMGRVSIAMQYQWISGGGGNATWLTDAIANFQLGSHSYTIREQKGSICSLDCIPLETGRNLTFIDLTSG